MAEPRYGDRVRLPHGQTGRYVDYDLALWRSCQDNDLVLSEVGDLTDGRSEPSLILPVPSDEELLGAVTACHYWRIRRG